VRAHNAVLNITAAGQVLNYRTAITGPDAEDWRRSEDKEWARLIRQTATIAPVHYREIPSERRKDISYYNPQVREKIKDGVVDRRVRGTYGGDRCNYPGDVTARTASLETVKVLLQSVVSTPGAAFLTADIVDFYLNSTLERAEYLRVQRRFLSDTAIQEHELAPYLHNDVVYFRVDKGMYGLPQAGILAQRRLKGILADAGYHEAPYVPCLFTHATSGFAFTLVIDDFGIKYTDEAAAQHLLDTLRAHYDIKVDWAGTKYLGINIHHDKGAHTITLALPGYVRAMQLRFQRMGARQVTTPCTYVPPRHFHRHGRQLAAPDDLSTRLSDDDFKEVQEIVGCALYYARVIDCTMLTAVNIIATEMAERRQSIQPHVQRLLEYLNRFPANQLIFKRCDMQLVMYADASFQSRTKARSVYGTYAFLGNIEHLARPLPIDALTKATRPSSPILCLSKTIPVVCASAAEAEYAANFYTAGAGCALRCILEALGHTQGPTTIFGDNTSAIGLAYDRMKPQKSRTYDLQFHWIKDRIRQGQFALKQVPSTDNMADFFTKALPADVHQRFMRVLVQVPIQPQGFYAARRAAQGNAFRAALCESGLSRLAA